jgi:MFS family permease
VQGEKLVRNSRGYQTGLVVLVFFTWGTVFLDRMSLVYLVPFIAPDLHLSHGQVGLLVSALALTWAASSLIFGALSDRIGRRPVLIPAVFAFSVLSWLSGIARSFAQLFVIRSLMGVAEGPTWSTITATVEASSKPESRGRNVGIVVSAAALVGLAIAPVLTTQVAARYGWRSAFFIAGVPGVILGLLLWRYLREPKPIDSEWRTTSLP